MLLARLIDEEPERAWLRIRRLVDKAETEVALQCVAAGPLEDLLCDHGPQFIVRVESAAQEQQQFKRALAIVWGHNRMVVQVRERISDAAGLRGIERPPNGCVPISWATSTALILRSSASRSATWTVSCCN